MDEKSKKNLERDDEGLFAFSKHSKYVFQRKSLCELKFESAQVFLPHIHIFKRKFMGQESFKLNEFSKR